MILASDGSPPVELFRESRGRGALTTRDIFQVSPDGAFLAYTKGGVIHIRSATGDERTLPTHEGATLIRFSPDGKYVAALAGTRYGEHADERVVLMELASGTTHDVLAHTSAWQLEWAKDGLVALAQDKDARSSKLVHVTPDGTEATLLDVPERSTPRFVASSDATRVVVFLHEWGDKPTTRILALETTAPEQQRELATLRDVEVVNTDISPDGTRVAYTTPRGLFTIEGAGKPTLVSARNNIHSVWFARDGRLGYASPTMATVLGGRGRAAQLETGADIRMLRFDSTSSDVLIASGTDARAWDPTAKQQSPRKRAASTKLGDVASEAVLGTDRFAGGVVVWTTPDLPRNPR